MPTAAVLDPLRLAALDAYGILDTPAEEGFDEVVRLTSRLCATPVALVSLVAADRQWFKARIGFPPCETDLASSVCRFVLDQPDLLVIPDLTADPRTAANPLVTGEPRIRFYAGAPLRTPAGQVVGSLCAIDTAPRPEGLTPDQAEDLRALARQVMIQLQFRVALRDRDRAAAEELRASAALRESETRVRALFEKINAGFCIIELRFDDGPDGPRPVDYRFLEVNPEFEAQTGLVGAAGKWMRDLAPDHEQHWFDLYGKVALTGEPIQFKNQAAALGRWYDVNAYRVGEPHERRVAILFNDISERVRIEARRDALLGLGDRLRDLVAVEDMAHAACETIGIMLDVVRVGYCDVDPQAETITVVRDWTAGKARSVAGSTIRLRDFGSYIDDLKRDETVVITDCRTDPRTSQHTDVLEGYDARAFVNEPIFERDRFLALLYVSTASPRSWPEEDLAFIRDVTSRVRLAIARVHAEEAQAVLNQELSHRLKNTLAMVLSIAVQTLRGVPDRAPVEAFEKRIHALSSAHDVLLRQSWAAAPAREVVMAVLAAAGHDDRIVVSGPDIELGPRVTLALSLLLHELSTNAAKYGALSVPQGRVTVGWKIAGLGDDAEVVFDWIEHGGPPPVEPPAERRKGFGSRLILMGLAGTGGVDLSYPQSGFIASMRAPLLQLQHV